MSSLKLLNDGGWLEKETLLIELSLFTVVLIFEDTPLIGQNKKIE